MGIDGFSKFIQKEFDGVTRYVVKNYRQKLPTYSHVFLDSNCFLYKCNSSSKELVVQRLITKKVNRFINLLQLETLKSIFLYLDGVGPLAKLSTQRQRRLQRLNLRAKNKSYKK